MPVSFSVYRFPAFSFQLAEKCLVRTVFAVSQWKSEADSYMIFHYQNANVFPYTVPLGILLAVSVCTVAVEILCLFLFSSFLLGCCRFRHLDVEHEYVSFLSSFRLKRNLQLFANELKIHTVAS